MTPSLRRLALTSGLAVVLAGCSGSAGDAGRDGSPGSNGKDSLVSLVTEAPGANCAAGGTAVLTGLDANGDAVLQPEEVTSTSYVCSGANGVPSLVRQDDAPVASCAFGGKVVSAGLDSNRNGVLDPAEVTSSSYVCNGATGQTGPTGPTGPAGLSSVFAITSEPAGSHCPVGGQKIQTGLDKDRDTFLDVTGDPATDEVQSTAYVCDGANRRSAYSEAQWGGVCPRGGARVDTWIDANPNGVIDAAELSSVATSYVCNRFAVQVVAGASHSCALLDDGTAKCWGLNQGGQLGDGTDGTGTGKSTPVAVAGLSGATALVAGGYHTCALLPGNTAKCWGNNAYGQLGNGAASADPLTPVAVTVVTGIAQLAAGQYHTCARLTDGTVSCWGLNNLAQIGLPVGNPTSQATAHAISEVTGATSLAAGSQHSCALVASGAVRCWGNNAHGELGDGTSGTPRPSSVAVLAAAATPLTGATSISASQVAGAHTCAVMNGGAVKCWGLDANGQLGDGAPLSNKTMASDVLAITSAASVTAGGAHTCAVLTDGTAKCWGLNGSGQLGDGSNSQTSSPVTSVMGLTGASSPAAGDDHTCAIVSAGTAKCWGNNADGQLGDGTATDRWTPFEVTDLLP